MNSPYVFHFFIFFFCLVQIINLCHGAKCINTERQALLAFKAGLTDPSGRLASWTGDECCKWSGVQCNNQTGHITMLDLRNVFSATSGDLTAYQKSCLGGNISSSLLKFEHLDYLDLSFNDFQGVAIPEFIGELKNLKYLNLSWSSFAGEIPPQIRKLSNLQSLDLYADAYGNSGTYKLQAEKLDWLSGLLDLKILNLGYVNLSNVGKNWLQTLNKLPSLVELRLEFCELRNIPLSLPSINFNSLSVLDLSQNSFNSIIPEWLCKLTSLTELHLVWNFFHGPMPTCFSNLKSLQILDLSSNLDLDGQIPGIFGKLPKLKVLDLSANNFNGEIHDFLSGFSGYVNNELVFLDLNANLLVGELPESLGVLKNLQFLDLSTNSFTGSIPFSIGNLSSLTKLDLSYNKMDGSIPESFGLLSKLVDASLSMVADVSIQDNSWSGVIKEAHLRNLKSLESLHLTTNSNKSLIFSLPSNWVPPFKLKYIKLENCRLGPLFPLWLQFQTEITSIVLRNVGISDSIPKKWFSQISSKISTLDLSNNQFRGNLPHQLSSPNLRSIHLESNQFNGPIPLWSTNATEIYLVGNRFSGSIPENIGQLMPSLEKLFFSWNNLTGKIPSSICDIEGLQILSLRSNRISGELPDCGHHWLFWAIDVSNNSLSGKIPSSFGLLSSLSVLLLSDNKLSGEIPSSLQNCSGLTNIDLKGNRLSGSLPPWIVENLSSLFMLSLGSNLFSGIIPQQFCIPQNLHILDLSYNELSGEIPKCIGNLTGFVNGDNTQAYEDLLYMAMRGRNPEYGSYIAKVNSINLSHNKISGGIPEAFGNLNSLSQLDLSYNSLAGKIPTQLKFKDLSIYEGNPSLCGPPLPKKCTERRL